MVSKEFTSPPRNLDPMDALLSRRTTSSSSPVTLIDENGILPLPFPTSIYCSRNDRLAERFYYQNGGGMNLPKLCDIIDQVLAISSEFDNTLMGLDNFVEEASDESNDTNDTMVNDKTGTKNDKAIQ